MEEIIMKCRDCGDEEATYECIDCGEKRCEWCAECGGACCHCQPQQFKKITPKTLWAVIKLKPG